MSPSQQTQFLLPIVRHSIDEYFHQENGKHSHLKPVLATDTGSRSFGFASVQSDFDVHMIFVQKDWMKYLTVRDLNPKETTAEFQIMVKDEEGREIEINCLGWDLIYFIRMLYKNNPAVVQCIRSSNICYLHPEFGREVFDLVSTSVAHSLGKLGYFQSTLSLVRNNINKYLTRKSGGKIRVKVYLYIIQYLLYSQAFFDLHGLESFDVARKCPKNMRNPDSSLEELLPSLQLQHLLRTTSLNIPIRFQQFIYRLIRIKRNNPGDPQIGRKVDLELWIILTFRTLFESRGRIPKTHATYEECDDILHKAVRMIKGEESIF